MTGSFVWGGINHQRSRTQALVEVSGVIQIAVMD